MFYYVNEVFYSIQGEGQRWGTANVFVRFAGCNLKCNEPEHGFDCDTDFSGGYKRTLEQLVQQIREVDAAECHRVIWTGGEPSLQLDAKLIAALPGYFHAIETNGTRPLPAGLDWVTCSPKTAEHTLRISDSVDELRYVRADQQALPRPSLAADHLFLSPTFTPDGYVDANAHRWCQKLVLENPQWRLSLQTHKLFSSMR